MLYLATWLQSADSSADSLKWIAISAGVIAIVFVISLIAVGVFASKAVTVIADLKKSIDDSRAQAMPVLANLYDLTLTTQTVLKDLAPKIKVMSENAVETSHAVRQTVAKLDVTLRQTADQAAATFTDANLRTQRQIVRVDAMVAATLAATAEIGATIERGIKVPARKIAEMATQSKHVFETLMDRAKALSVGLSAGLNTYIHRDPPPPNYRDDI
jgi:methyl-accepting chemotaxis protein